jgi:hypothetical protein
MIQAGWESSWLSSPHARLRCDKSLSRTSALEPAQAVKSGVMKRQDEDEWDELTILTMLKALQRLEDPIRPPAKVISWPKAALKNP